MKKVFLYWFFALLICSCTEKETSHNYTSVSIESVFEDSISIRAIELLEDNTLAFAGSKGVYGSINTISNTVRTSVQTYDSIIPEFRSVAHTKSDFFMLSVGSPALLFKTGTGGKMELVYKEEGAGVFYDAMTFWNDLEGIAVGDYNNGCFAIIITRDGGKTWQRLPCASLPQLDETTGAYAASNTNIVTFENKSWVMTSKEQLLFTGDKGRTWEVIDTPIQIEETYQGIYSIASYDGLKGYGIGGDFSKPNLNVSNKISTSDGGRTWSLMANGQSPGYKSCVQYIPNSGGLDLIATGYTGISYSEDGGISWKSLSDEGFYTIRFLNDSIAYAAGKNRIAKLTFR